MRNLTPIRVDPHALERYCERVGPIHRYELANRIRGSIAYRLGVGCPVRSGVIRVPISCEADAWAVCLPSLLGGWDVVTVVVREKREVGVS